MPSRPTPQVTSWSFSRYMDYVTCPAKFKYKHLDKLKEPGSPAMDRGSAIHKLAEDYTLGRIPRIPAELKLFKDEFAALKKQKVKFVEENWAFTRSWDITEWNNWNECWLRVKLDVAYIPDAHNVLVPIDHKTGKMRADKNVEYEMQLELYGLAGLVQQPTIEVVSPRLWYLDEGVIYPDPAEREIEYTRADVPKLKKIWELRVRPMFNDKRFAPKQNSKCVYCHFRKANGGPCKY